MLFRSCVVALACFIVLGSGSPLFADDKTGPDDKSVAAIAEAARKSLVVIVFAGRDGKQQGLGSGFVVHPDGLIATNLHVIGEARPISVQFTDGRRFDVTAVHASDKKMDLALLRIDAKELAPLPVGDSRGLKDGQPIVVLGHPRGLKNSVVSGVLSGKRDVEGMSMLQLAIPIEQGNSGGPVLDMQGRVQGIVTMKSLVTPNLGFAVPSSALKPLLDRPNPIPMSRWLTIGTLDPRDWKTVFGGRWRQRAGRIITDGMGGGFGGRSLCLYQQAQTKGPFEVTVTVKLDDESGAAGLIFGGDGQDKHYGFYPSAGKVRLTRFDGPDVYSWKILKMFSSAHYRPGDWNSFKVRIDGKKFQCWVNDHLEIDDAEADWAGNAVGLAQFRGTGAQFKHFAVADKIPNGKPAEAVVVRINKAIEAVSFKDPLAPKSVAALAPDSPASLKLLRDKAQKLEEQAGQLRKLAQAVHVKKTLQELAQAVQVPEEKVDLLHATLLLSRLDNEELDVAYYRKEADRLARLAVPKSTKESDERERLKALNKFLFEERGFHGSRVDYYTRANSYLNEVIDDREGLPITLSVLYMELARRLKINVVGVPFPGHFMVRHEPAKGEIQVIDVYDGGKFLSEKEAEAAVQRITGKPLQKEHLVAAGKKAILVRMLHNLLNVAESEKDGEGMLRYLDAIVTITPDAGTERWLRAVLRFQAGQRQGALEDADWLLDRQPPGVPIERVRELRGMLKGEE